MIADLWAHLTYRTPAQNPALHRRGLLGADLAGWRITQEFGPPPAAYYAEVLDGQGDAQLLAGPQRRSPGWTAARATVSAGRT